MISAMFGAQFPNPAHQWASEWFEAYPTQIRNIAMGLAASATDLLAVQNLQIAGILCQGLPTSATRTVLSRLPRVPQPIRLMNVRVGSFREARDAVFGRFEATDSDGQLRASQISSLIHEGTMLTLASWPEVDRTLVAQRALAEHQLTSHEHHRLYAVPPQRRPELRHQAEPLAESLVIAKAGVRREFPDAVVARSVLDMPGPPDVPIPLPLGPAETLNVKTADFWFDVLDTDHQLDNVFEPVRDAFADHQLLDRFTHSTLVLTQVESRYGTSHSAFRLRRHHGWTRCIDYQADNHGPLTGEVRRQAQGVADLWNEIEMGVSLDRLLRIPEITERDGSGLGLSL